MTYTLTATYASYVLTGQAAPLIVGRPCAALSASFALTGQPSLFSIYPYRMLAETSLFKEYAGVGFAAIAGLSINSGIAYIADTYTVRRWDISTGLVTTVAGDKSTLSEVDGIGLLAKFYSVWDTVYLNGDIYTVDNSGNTVRKIESATGLVTTIAGGAGGIPLRFQEPNGICSDGTNLYVNDRSAYTIFKVSLATRLSTVLAGSATFGAGSTDGTGSAAYFNLGHGGNCTDNTNLYVADSSNNTIRKVVISTGVVTTLAGTAGVTGSADGTGTSAQFSSPHGITTDGTNLYVADMGNSTIRKVVISTGVVTTLAGTAGVTGSADGTGTAALFYYPHGITTDGTNLYVADYNNYTIRKIVIATGVVTTLAGSAGVWGSADGTGTSARFYGPHGITTDNTNLYVADNGNATIRKIVIATGVVTTIAGTAGVTGSADGWSVDAKFDNPYDVIYDNGNLYITEASLISIRKLVLSTGMVTTFFRGIDGVGIAASFNTPVGITTDGTNLYVADSGNNAIRKLTIATAQVTTLAGTSWGFTDNIGSAAEFSWFGGSISYLSGNIYIADTGNNAIRKLVLSTGMVTTIAGNGHIGAIDGTGTAARFNYPYSVKTDNTNLYVADSSNSTIRKIVIATGVVTTLAGTAGVTGSADGTGTSAQFSSPHGITTDGTNLYVADMGNSTIRKVVISTGVVTTVLNGRVSVNTDALDGVGKMAALTVNHPLTATSQTYALSGQNTILKWGLIMPAAVGAYAVTPPIAGLYVYPYRMPTPLCSILLTAFSAILAYTRKVEQDVKSNFGFYVPGDAKANYTMFPYDRAEADIRASSGLVTANDTAGKFSIYSGSDILANFGTPIEQDISIVYSGLFTLTADTNIKYSALATNKVLQDMNIRYGIYSGNEIHAVYSLLLPIANDIKADYASAIVVTQDIQAKQDLLTFNRVMMDVKVRYPLRTSTAIRITQQPIMWVPSV